MLMMGGGACECTTRPVRRNRIGSSLKHWSSKVEPPQVSDGTGKEREKESMDVAGCKVDNGILKALPHRQATGISPC